MWVDDIIIALKNLNGIGKKQDIYHEIQKIKTNLSGDWEAVVRRTIQQNSSDTRSWLGHHDFFYSVNGIGEGIWGLRNFFPSESDKKEVITDSDLPAQRKDIVVKRIIRNSYLISQLKEYHKNICQICEKTLQLSNTEFYSEGHHIQGIGNPHNGPDKAENIIILCPNCHALCDYNIIKLDKRHLDKAGRNINIKYINYHNSLIEI